MDISEPTTTMSTMEVEIRRLVDQIVALAKPLRIILFGSRAVGAARADSDIDLLIVMPDGTDRRAAVERIGSKLPRPGVGIDLIVVTPAILAELADNPGLIYRQILRTGKDIYKASDDNTRLRDGHR